MITKHYSVFQALCFALVAFIAPGAIAKTSNNGGGGGTFVVMQTGTVPLIIAGGGGGASGQCCGGQGNGAPGVTSTSGTVGLYTNSVFGSGGTGGNGGTAGNGSYSAGSGGGGGFSTNGGNASGNSYPYSANGGASFQNGGAGGLGALDCGGVQQVYGGFGGGGGAAVFPGFYINGPGGGGGGYSGGAGTNGGSQWGAGGGGGSYNAGTSQVNYDGSDATFGNSGDGSVSITWAGGSQTFGKVHNTLQSFTVPTGVTSITIVAKGAQGGNADAAPSLSYPPYFGGKGAYMSGTFAVTPGDVLTILVGETPESYAAGTCGTSACATPTAFTVTGGGGYCAGTSGAAIGLSASESGVTYQLYRNSTIAVGSSVSGTGSSITFGNQTVVGTYSVVATRTSGSCTNNMSNSVTVSINSLPSASAAVSPLYPMSGQEIQTIYLGYTPSSAQTETITITPSGGNSASYTYSWQRSSCNGSTMSTLMSNGSPVTASSYNFTPSASDICPGNVGSSRVDLQACKLEYSIVSPK